METIWIAVYTNEMLTKDFITFLEFLSLNEMKYISYHGVETDEIFIEITGDMTGEFNENLSHFIYYLPIILLEKEPESFDIILEYNIIKELSNI